jgi:VanZ family protein
MQQAEPTATSRTKKPAMQTTLLPRYLTLAYLALVVYASLHPFSDWRNLGFSPIAFLDTGWPRYWTVFDLLINVLAYLPLGFLCALILRNSLSKIPSVLLAMLLTTLLSFCLECIQTWLPSRVPSNLDLACNACGGSIGALLTLWRGERFFTRVTALQQRLLVPVRHAELGLVMLGLWLLTQLSPETLLFGAGDLRHLLGLTPAVPYAAPSFFVIETCIIICNTMAIGLIARTLLSEWTSPHMVLLIFFVLALTVRTLATALLVTPHDAFAWLTPGARFGLLIGGAVLTLMLFLPPVIRIAIAGLALMAGAVLVNLAPPNPYSMAALLSWRQGHFLNFNGLTRLVASVWPFLALPYLTLLGRRL